MDELIAADAPLPPGRALALMVAVTRTVAALDPERAPSRLEADQVRLHEDGSVSFEVPRTHEPAGSPAPEPELGASIGRLLFALLTGRAPVGRDDAFEPTLRAALAPSTCALIARLCLGGPWPVARRRGVDHGARPRRRDARTAAARSGTSPGPATTCAARRGPGAARARVDPGRLARTALVGRCHRREISRRATRWPVPLSCSGRRRSSAAPRRAAARSARPPPARGTRPVTGTSG